MIVVTNLLSLQESIWKDFPKGDFKHVESEHQPLNGLLDSALFSGVASLEVLPMFNYSAMQMRYAITAVMHFVYQSKLMLEL